MRHHLPRLCNLLPCALVLALAACNSSTTMPPTEEAPRRPQPDPRKPYVESADLEFIQTQALDFAQTIRPDDRILFVGDDLTQQMQYTRAVATGLLPLHPDLRFFNGGRNKATAASAGAWLNDLLDITQPTVVFVCLPPVDDDDARYRAELAQLIAQTRNWNPAAPPRVILVSSPAIEPGGAAGDSATLANQHRRAAAVAVRQLAADENAGFIDLFVPTLRVYQAAAQSGASLTYDGKLPNESGHVVIASVILYGLGVSSEQLTPVGWSPLLPMYMAPIRGALGLELPIPTDIAARRSRELYMSMIPFDEAFFRAWRLSTAAERPGRIEQAETAWTNVRQTLATP